MDRKRRTKIFIDYASEETGILTNEIEENYEIEMIQEPTEGLTMIKVRETAKNTLFYLGEVLITECKVRINDQIGLGVVTGNNKKLSYNLAVLDAAYELNLPILKEWEEIFLNCEKKGIEDLKRKRNIIAKTKVDFETMNE